MGKYFISSYFAGKRVHLGVSGSISAYKAVDLLRACVAANLVPTVALTESACRFIRPLSFSSLGAEAVYTSMFREDKGQDGTPPIMDSEEFVHLLPGAECDAFVIMPASATSMAKIAMGIADEILSAQALAWSKPLIIAPAMNPRMWNNSSTKANIDTLRSRGHLVIFPSHGKVACGDEGQGKLADLREVYLHLLRQLSPQDLSGMQVMLTLGPTREQWDGVRYWSNLSSGIMGSSLALAAWLRGAEVTAICGPCSQLEPENNPWLPESIKRYDVSSGKEMYMSAMELWPNMDTAICTAAVADFYPEPLGPQKFKKSGAGEDFAIKFRMNADILAELGKNKKSKQKLIGFAAETENLEMNAKEKLQRKNADILIGNLVGIPDSGFGTAKNKVFVTDAHGKEENWPVLPKTDVAWRILDWLLTL